MFLSLFNAPSQNIQAESLPIIYSRISGIVWPFNLYNKTAPYCANHSTFQTEFSFQLINHSNSSVTIENNCTILFFLNVSAELLEGEVDTSTDTNSCPIAITYDLLPGVNNYTYKKNIHFNQANISRFPIGNYTLSYSLLGQGDFDFYAYKLYLKVTEDLVEISQEDGSLEIILINEKEIEELTDLTETPIAFIASVLGLILTAPIIVKFRKKKK